MATLDDVSSGVLTTLAGILFPGQSYQESAVANIVSPWDGAPGAADLTLPAKVYRGYPQVTWENTELAAGRVGIAVNNVPRMNRSTTRFQPFYTYPASNSPTLQVNVSSGTAAFSGTAAAGQVVGLTVGDIAYAYRASNSDTPPSVAAALAAEIPGATSSGATLNVSGIVSGVVVCDQIAILHTGQHEQMVEISCLVPPVGPEGGGLARAAVARAIAGLKTRLTAAGTLDHFITLADGSVAKLTFSNETQDDTPRNQSVWRYWGYFLVEYDETIIFTQPTSINVGLQMTAGAAAVQWIGAQPS